MTYKVFGVTLSLTQSINQSYFHGGVPLWCVKQLSEQR